MMLAAIRTALFFSVILGAMSQQNCDLKDVEICGLELKMKYPNDEPIIVKDEEDHNSLCEIHKRMLSCLKDVMHQCAPEKRAFLLEVFQDMSEVDTCSENSEARQVYLKHLSCFNKYAEPIHHCTSSLKEWVEENTKKLPSDPEELLREICCRVGQTMSCASTVIQDGCPSEASNLYSKMLNKANKNIRKLVQCDKVKDKPCNSATRGRLYYLLFIISSMIAVNRAFRKSC